MTKALETISEDHRGMWRLTTALEELGRQLGDAGKAHDVELFGLILDYFEGYIEQVHQPKEENFLYRAVQLRTQDSDALIAEFEDDHAAGPVFLKELRRQQRRLVADYPVGVAEFQETVAAYVKTVQRHIQREETLLFPVARQLLDAAAWEDINAAFADDQAAMDQVRAEFRALMSRIVNFTPAPLGLDLEHTAAAAAPPAPPLLEIRNLASHYGRIAALRGASLDIREGQLVALVGANGAGKTTLLRTISGVQKASGGSVHFAGADITHLRADKRVRLGICQVPEGRQVFGPLSVADNIRLGAYTGCNKKCIADDMERMYSMFPILKQKADLPAGTLSGGQQQMLAMARALMGRPRLLLLDEPSMGLAPLLVEEIFNAVIELRRQAMTIFLVEQNAHAALAIADHAYVIESGEVVLSGSGKELLDNERVKEAYLGI
ncbi:MAG: ATP-binding cassette domain-containing protein [Rhodocyclales bacterium]|nr:ATP-binding cassette domain-containing protein [Rhodocyclales bacterium]